MIVNGITSDSKPPAMFDDQSYMKEMTTKSALQIV